MEPELTAVELAALLDSIVPNYDKFFMFKGKTVLFQNAMTRYRADRDLTDCLYGSNWLTGVVDDVAERHIVIDGHHYGYSGLEVKLA